MSNPFDVFETNSQVVNTNRTDKHQFSRKISLWLSSQHLLIVGVIPYTLTLVFNLLLIRCLRSCPKPQDYMFQASGGPSAARPKQTMHVKMSYCCFMQFTSRVIPKTNRIVMKPFKIALVNYFKSKPHRQQNTRCSCGRKILSGQFSPEGHSILATGGSREEPRNTWLPLKAKPKLVQVRTNSSGGCPLKVTAHFKKTSSSNPDIGRKGWWVGRTRTTILLLVVTFTFIGLSLPYLIYAMLTQFGAIDKSQVTDFRVAHTIEELCRFLLFVNNCLNLFIHMTGHQFRRGFHALLMRCHKGLREYRLVGSTRHSLQAHWYRSPPGGHFKGRWHKRQAVQNMWLHCNDNREGLLYKASLEFVRNNPLACCPMREPGKLATRRTDVRAALLR